MSACSNAQAAVSTGSALQAEGPQTDGVLGFPHARVGKTYRFAFPLFKNRSDAPIVIESVRLTQVPRGVRVIGYPIYSVDDTDGYILDNQDDIASPRDMTKMPNYAGKSITVKPHKTSDRYAMVQAHVIGRVQHHLGGCEVTYSQAGRKYRQNLRCDFALDMK